MEAAQFKRARFWLTGMAVAWLGGCAVAPPPDDTALPEADSARRALAAGDFAAAARSWQQAAMSSSGGQRHLFRLNAAEAWFEANDILQTRSQLRQVDERQLNGPDRARFALLHADLALSEGDALRAEFYLEAARDGLASAQRARYEDLAKRVARFSADPGSYALATAASALKTRGPYDTGQGVAILKLLEDVPSGVLRGISEDTANAYGLAGWPELAARVRQVLAGGGSLAQEAAIWSMTHPDHEVTEFGFVELVAGYRRLFSLPVNVGVLLPESGGLAAAGKAIRDGLVSAFLDSGEDVSLRFYATTDDPESAVSAYFEALGEGAQWVIGPLRRESVHGLLELGGLGLPILALNDIDDTEQRRDRNLVFGLSLSQEQEAKAIARRALANGWKSAIMLSADNPWGLRVESAFGEEFVAGGGEIAAGAVFDPAESDHSPLLTSLLKIDESTDRKNRLQATLGVSLSFEPARRDDFDLVFLAADPEQGRQIRPQLKFHDAGGKPVLAMGRIYSGTEDRAANRDLDGIAFPSTRWNPEAQDGLDADTLTSLRGGSLAPLYALGMDAWQLLPWLPLMNKDPDLHFPGKVGDLSMGRKGQLLREPAWAKFSGGRVQPLTWPAAPGEGLPD